MRDAESLLDQVLATSDEVIDAALVEDLLGLAQEDAVDGFIDALADGDARAGIEVLDGLEAEGRDLVAFADQVVDAPARTARGCARRRKRRYATAGRGRTPADRHRRQPQRPRRISLAARAGPVERRLVRGAGRDRATRSPSRSPCDGRRRIRGHRPRPPRRRRAGRRSRRARMRPHGERPPPPRRPRAGPSAPTDAAASPASAGPGTATRGTSSSEPPEPAAVVRSTGPGSDAPDDLLADLRRRWPEIVAWIGRNPANKPAGRRTAALSRCATGSSSSASRRTSRSCARRRSSAASTSRMGSATSLAGPSGYAASWPTSSSRTPRDTTDEGVDLVAQARRVFDGELADIEDIG